MLIRRERPADSARLYEIHEAAFGQKLEADLDAALRGGGHVIEALSLVCEIDGVAVGHVNCSRGRLGDGSPSVGLGPVGVMPELQGQDIGSALMHASLAAADALDEPMVALLGNPEFYGRFGFVASTDVGITAPTPEWGPFFQVRALSAFQRSAEPLTFAYAPPFDDLD